MLGVRRANLRRFRNPPLPTLQALLVPLCVLAVAAVLLGLELRSWHAARRSEFTSEERDYRRRRFRRRVQADGMLAVVAILMGVGSLLDPARHPSTYVGIWVGVFVLVLWLILLALADAAVSLHRGQQAKQELLAEKARLEADLAPKPRGPSSPV
jgi:hypothetical protein